MDTHWKVFEQLTADVLTSAGFDTKRNIEIGAQQVDIYATRRELGRVVRFAIECKNTTRALDKTEIAEIVVKYNDLIERRLIDEVMIISSSGVTANAAAFLDGKRGIRHLTFDDLSSSIIDVKAYLDVLESQYITDGLAEYYIPLRILANDGEEHDAYSYVLKWIRDPSRKPLAILSSYGTGKTTLSRHLAYTFAREHRQKSSNRIPLVIDLGRISDVQGLEGLLGKIMTAEYAIRNYTFSLFMELNRKGRFLIILDSFDEMKHGITWEAFLRNMDELRRLSEGTAKIIICGRPSVFMNEAEKIHGLHGKQRVGGNWIRVTSFDGFEEVSLLPFGKNQIQIFLERYLSWLKRSKILKSGSAHRVLRRLEDEKTGRLYDLASRPVQLQMIATVLPNWDKSIDALTRVVLYDHFIDFIIERECKKAARMTIGIKRRHAFSRALAWHMWTTSGRDFIRADEIPEQVFNQAGFVTESEPSLRRELIVGTCLDLKPPDLLRFSHRSLQEFLVAEELTDRLADDKLSIQETLDFCTPEVAEFFEGILDGTASVRLIPALLKHHNRIPTWFERRLERDHETVERLLSLVKPGMNSIWPGLFMVFQFASADTIVFFDKKAHQSYEMSRLGAALALVSVASGMYIHLGMHCLALHCFPKNSINVHGMQVFTSFIRDIVKQQPFASHSGVAFKTLLSLVRSINLHSRGRRTHCSFDFQQLKLRICAEYRRNYCLSDMLTLADLSERYDFATSYVGTVAEYDRLQRSVSGADDTDLHDQHSEL